MGETGSAEERREKLVQITGARLSLRGSGPDYVARVLVSLSTSNVCQLHKLTLSDQAQVTLQLTVFPI